MAIDVHSSGMVLTAGPALQEASAAILLVHGRGATAQGMLELFDAIGVDDVAAIAPQAAGQTWYPQSFLAPLPANQPYLDSGLRKIETAIQSILDSGMASERIMLLGFSQGACLTAEFVARHPRKYGAVAVLTGGLIGPPGTPRDYPGSMDGTPIFLGSGDPDPHVPFARVQETEAVFARMGATVELRRYPGTPHTINDDELHAVRTLLRNLVRS